MVTIVANYCRIADSATGGCSTGCSRCGFDSGSYSHLLVVIESEKRLQNLDGGHPSEASSN